MTTTEDEPTPDEALHMAVRDMLQGRVAPRDLLEAIPTGDVRSYLAELDGEEPPESFTAQELIANLPDDVVLRYARDHNLTQPVDLAEIIAQLPKSQRNVTLRAAQIRDERAAKALVEAEEQQAGPDAWTPVDVRQLLAGGLEPLRPTLMPRSDNRCLLYPGRTHSFSGESGSGKSWLAQWATAQALQAGGLCLYLDYESGAASVVARLRALGCTDDQIARLTYVNPDAAPTGEAFESLLRSEHGFTLAVVDGVTEALALSGLSGDSLTNNNDAVTRWHAMLPKRIATETGAAVVQVDHVTKSKDGRGGYAIGGQAKRASITGAAYVVVPRETFGRGRAGWFDLYVSKDREGFVLGAPDGADTATGKHVGRVTVSSTQDGERVGLEVLAPLPNSADDQAGSLMARVAAFLAELPHGHEGASTNTVKREVTGNEAQIGQALAALVSAGYVAKKAKGQSMLHRLVKPYAPEFAEEDEL